MYWIQIGVRILFLPYTIFKEMEMKYLFANTVLL
jgi:hypothetical protein